jgi:hypothetical protein
VIALVIAGCGHLGFQTSDGAVGDGARDGARDSIDRTDVAAAACPAFALFCDDFETGDVSRWTGTHLDPGVSLGIESATVHGGMYALQGTVPMGSTDGDAASVTKTFGDQSTGMIAVREWIYQVQPLNHFDGVMILEPVASGLPAVLVAGDGSTLWDVSEDSGTSVDHGTTQTVATTMWTCVELDYTFGSPSTIELYVADALVLQVAATDTATTFGRLFAGAARSSSVVGTNTIIDDVVIAQQHIGCQ